MEVYLVIQVAILAFWIIYKGINIKDDILS